MVSKKTELQTVLAADIRKLFYCNAEYVTRDKKYQRFYISAFNVLFVCRELLSVNMYPIEYRIFLE